MRTISCGSPYGQGGIGQHFAQLVEEARAAGVLARYYAPRVKSAVDDKGCPISVNGFRWASRYTPLRFSQTWKSTVKAELFDRKVAAALSQPIDRFMGFVGYSLNSFREASKQGAQALELIATTSHVDNVMRLHQAARQQLGISDSWMSERQHQKALWEYEQADVIYVHSEYTRQSFLAHGISPSKLQRMYLKVNPRFVPPQRHLEDGVFRVVYVGRLEATKGIPLLLEAFSQLPTSSAELTLVGGWSTRVMRRYLQKRMARDPRIRVAPGDPLPVLQRADVFVHPSYEDGFGYAPMEALACGIPVIVTSDTGMKEYVREGVNGYLVPTGDQAALLDRIVHLWRHPLRREDATLLMDTVDH